MKVLVCDGELSFPDGSPFCSGSWSSVTSQEIVAQSDTQLTWEDVNQYKGEIITLFAAAAFFVILRKVSF